MDFFILTILVCVLSFGGVLLLFTFYFHRNREVTAEVLCEALVVSEPFFEDFSGVSSFFKKLYIFTRRKFGWLVQYIKGLNSIVNRYRCYFSNFVHGRHSVEKNGCKGYWKEINDNNKPG